MPTSPLPSLTWSHLSSCAEATDLHLIGATSAEPLGVRERRALEIWQEEGHAGELNYMKRSADLLADARNLLPNAASLLFVLAPYEARDPGQTPRGFGRVARYAWGRDYHKVLPRALKRFAKECVAGTSIQWRVFSDAIPLLERPYAARSGLGFIGKHTLLIRSGFGSYALIGGVIFSAPIEDVPEQSVKGSCGSCFKCGGSCPTGAIVSPYVVSAPRCISYLTIEKRGALAASEREMLGSWLFGCDICQEVCPHNHRAHKFPPTPLEGLAQSGRTGPFIALSDVLSIASDELFLARFAGTPLMRARREGLIRNALCVAVNQRFDLPGGEIMRLLREDASSVVRQHALGAAFSLEVAPRELLQNLAERDPSPPVRDEWLALSE